MDPDHEARVFTRYITGRDAVDSVIRRYNDLTRGFSADPVVRFLLKNPFWISSVDAWHAMFRRKSLLRKKLFYLFCILETEPAYADLFLSPKRSSLPGIALKLFLSGLRIIPGGLISMFAR
jgi:hypothetical protein